MSKTIISLTSLLACILFFSGGVSAAEYIYRDLMANTLPNQKCLTQDQASSNAQDPYTVHKYAKRFCETQGYGWHVSEEKNNGKLVCKECSGDRGKYQCYLEDVVVSCKRIKPGSVGLIPGEG